MFPTGTRIIYERKFLMELRNSPLARTPPSNLPVIPGITCDSKVKPQETIPEEHSPGVEEAKATSGVEDHTQFQMDI
ncbi:Eukaryotic translation initiation factor 4E-binding 1 [Paramuricea clavata]|uniref:Eukaryotic translation initiation factor 4E-binding 1 n=1 Tax=Paramuricea clavata TaxID=317549 RepID=A0A7D9LN59_PARCT|nr:Eukaryotic translation initiation factor 4E-binding 1 [Paramuricea clavata]